VLLKLLSDKSLILFFQNRIPSEIGRCSNLSVMSLESNDLSRSIPSELGSLSQLQWLMLFGNRLSGSIPAELGLLTNLTYLRLENNMLRGELPDLGTLTNLEHLSLQSTSVTGSIPEGFCELIEEDQMQVGVECGRINCDCGCICYNSYMA